MSKYIAVTSTGKHYWKRLLRSGPYGVPYEKWDTTEDIKEAHRFPSRKAAERFLADTPKGHSVLEVEK